MSYDQVPVDEVNAFLLQEGYTASVLQTYYRKNGYTLQEIYLGVDVDPSPLPIFPPKPHALACGM
ncbi:MAG: hypothetical protein OXN25_17815 [Candidatus Poribacteria bacterium]|nr:hypothetical protein [Candidatus Poribacteria bacterium]